MEPISWPQRHWYQPRRCDPDRVGRLAESSLENQAAWPGSSSPILTEQYVFVTSYSGYDADPSSSGNIQQLQRHVSCIHRHDGSVVWSRTIDAVQPEDPYHGMGLPEHGYASNTPVTDGKAVFAFLGKSGVYAFDLQGNELWRVSVGTESGNRRWGSAASLTLYDNLVIVNAAEESRIVGRSRQSHRSSCLGRSCFDAGTFLRHARHRACE